MRVQGGRKERVRTLPCSSECGATAKCIRRPLSEALHWNALTFLEYLAHTQTAEVRTLFNPILLIHGVALCNTGKGIILSCNAL